MHLLLWFPHLQFHNFSWREDIWSEDYFSNRPVCQNLGPDFRPEWRILSGSVPHVCQLHRSAHSDSFERQAGGKVTICAQRWEESSPRSSYRDEQCLEVDTNLFLTVQVQCITNHVTAQSPVVHYGKRTCTAQTLTLR